jgi:uncharacterized membrane protein
MKKVVLGIFSDRSDAEAAFDELEEIGYNPKDISIVMKDHREAESLANDTGADVAGGAVSGATTGGALGALAGFLIGAGIIPGLGALLIGGPLAAALGLTGAAATTVSGAATGALAGGLLGALMGFGLSEDEAREYEEGIKAGGILVAVPARDAQEGEVRDVLEENGADKVRAIDTAMDMRTEDTEEDEFVDASVDRYDESHDRNQPAFVGTKGGSSETPTKRKTVSRGSKGGRSSGRGWHGDSEEHAVAAHGKNVRSRRKA